MVDIVIVQRKRDNLLTEEGAAELLIFLYLSTPTNATKWQNAQCHMELSLGSNFVMLIL